MKEKTFTLRSILLMVLLAIIPCSVMADDYVPLESIEIPDFVPGYIYKLNQGEIFSVVRTPENATCRKFTFELSDPDAVELDLNDQGTGGQIKFVKAGTYTLTVKAVGENVSTSVTFTVARSTNKPISSKYVDVDVASSIDASKTKWSNDESVTTLLTSLVAGVMEEHTFTLTNTSIDIKGITHYDCTEIDDSGCLVDGCELIVHVGSDGKLLCVTGFIATEMDWDEKNPQSSDVPAPVISPDVSAYNQKADITGNMYYYKKEGITGSTAIAGATDGNGTYVLQDPGRVYTLDYTNNVPQNTLPEILATAKNFTSTSPAFTTGYDGLKSEMTSITFDYLNYVMPDEKKLKVEIRKCSADDMTAGDLDAAWEKGTAYASSEGEVVDGSVTFNFSGVTYSMPNRQMDPDANIEKEGYIIRLSNDTKVLSTEKFQASHNSGPIYMPYNETSLQGKVHRQLLECQPALDIHWGMERILDTYKETFGINSYNNQGSPVVVLVNFDEPGNAQCLNATNDGCALVEIGLGAFTPGSSSFYPVVELGVVAHEFTHAVANKLKGGKNTDTSALNESYADIIGKMVERKNLDNSYTYQTLGETVSYVSWKGGIVSSCGSPLKYMRRFDDPSKGPNNDPNYYKGVRWNELAREQHSDAGVQNYWFYLLCTGATDFQPEQGEKVTITAIPRDSAELITFGALMYFATKDLDYPAARKNSIHAAEIYFGKNSQEVQSVYNAWYAVGVGTDEWQPGDPTTSCDAIASNEITQESVRKVLKDGRLVIQKNGKEYNAAGQEL